MKKRFAALVSLGCVKNLVDSETMIPQLQRFGYTMTEDPALASLVVVNTCGFLESAVEEAVERILELAELKHTGSCECLVAVGCMVQRYGKKLPSLLPEVDLFLGTSHYDFLENALRLREAGDSRRLWIAAPRQLLTSASSRVRSTGPFSAYLKIAEGCSNQCSFCLIPRLRGPYRSRTVEDVMAEAARLAKEGVQEINLVAQDTTAFGSDRPNSESLIHLLEAMDSLEGVEWVRLLYAYPDRVDTALLRTMAQSKKIVPYLDIPFQHCAPSVLRAMQRQETNSRTAEALIDLIRFHLPDVALRTSLIVGFPGETASDFEALLSFVERSRFDHLGVFAFSPEAGTRAARLPGQIDEETGMERLRTVVELQQSISRDLLEKKIGQVRPVLIEGIHPETELLLTGRLSTQAPEVDGNVIITRGMGVMGQVMPARITAAHDYDLEAELLTGE